MKNNIETWNDYWSIFDDVCESLMRRNKSDISDKLKDAQLFVNGMTDGWFEFLNRLSFLIDDSSDDLDDMEKQNLLYLGNYLREILNNR